MRKTSPNPKKFIISCRVNAREMRALQEMAEESGISITMLLRQSLNLQAQGILGRRQIA